MPFGHEDNIMIQSVVSRWLIEYSGGLINNERQARYIIYGVTFLIFIISLFISAKVIMQLLGIGGNIPSAPPGYDI